MDELLELYETMGISPAVYAYGERTLEKLKDRFAAIDPKPALAVPQAIGAAAGQGRRPKAQHQQAGQQADEQFYRHCVSFRKVQAFASASPYRRTI